MDKAHITMTGTCPVFMTYTNGLAGDSPQLTSHIDALLRMQAKIDEYRLDGNSAPLFSRLALFYRVLVSDQITDLQHLLSRH